MKIELLYHPKTKAIIDFVLYFVCYYYVILASINDGFTGILLGIPFALFLIVDIIRKKHFYRYLSVSVLALSSLFYFSDRSTWTLTYPMVGNTLEVTQNVNYNSQNQWIYSVDGYLDGKSSFSTFKSGAKINVVNQKHTGNPDFEVAYTFNIDVEKDGVVEKYRITDHALHSLYRSQNREYRQDRFQNLLTRYLIFFTHMFFSYPVVIIIFIGLVFIRGKASENNSKSTFIAHRET